MAVSFQQSTHLGLDSIAGLEGKEKEHQKVKGRRRQMGRNGVEEHVKLRDKESVAVMVKDKM